MERDGEGDHVECKRWRFRLGGRNDGGERERNGQRNGQDRSLLFDWGWMIG